MKNPGTGAKTRFDKATAFGIEKTKLTIAPPKPAQPARQRRLASSQPSRLLPQQFPDSELRMEVFEYFNPIAREVLLAGSFNGWQPQANPMSNHRGKWTTQVLLRPGKYEYRFVVDGEWQDDPMAAAFVANTFGTLNCIREVKAF